MKKRLTSWLLVLTMIVSLIPSTLITASAADVTGITTEVSFDNVDVADISQDGSKIQLPLTVTDGTEAATATELTAPAADTQYTENDSVTLTAKVTSNDQPVTQGEVVFWINGTALGTQGQIKAVTVSADGIASTKVNASAANHFKINEANTIKASYRAVPGAYAASESGETTVRVNEAANVTANLQFTPSSIEKKIQLTNNTANLKWEAGTNTLTVLEDFTTKMPIVFTGFGAPVTLDLNGHTVTTDVPGYGNNKVVDQYGLILRDGSAVTIKDSSEGKNGAFVSTWSTAYLDSGSSLTLESGKVQGLGKGDGSGVINTSGRGDKVTLNIKGGKLVIAGTASPYQPASGYCALMKNADVIMSGGVLRADGDKDKVQGDVAAYARGIRGMSDTTIQVTGGEFQNFKGPAIVTYGATATATVTGMTLESDWRTVEVTGGSTVTLSNCTVKQTDAVRPQGLTGNKESACAIEVDDSTLNLNNTSVTGVNTSDGAIYGWGRSALNITGGSVTSTGKSAIEIYDSTTATLTDVTVKNSASGFPAIYASLNNKLYVTNGSIDATAGNSVTLQGTQVAKFTNVTITNEGKGWAGIFANAYFNDDNTIAQSSIVTIKGGSITAQDGCGLWIRNKSSVTLQENAVVTNHAEDGQSTYPAVYVREGSTLAATGGSITAAKSSNAINIDDVVNATANQPGCSVKLTNVAVSSTDSTWNTIYAGQNSTLTVSGGTVTAGQNGNAIRGWNANVIVKDKAALTGSGQQEAVYAGNGGKLEISDSTIENRASDGIGVGAGSVGTVTGTTVTVQDGYGIRAVGSTEAQASVTLTDSKVTVQDGMALYGENGTITVNSGSYYSKNNFAITGTAPYSFIINGGYFHGSADTLDATRADEAMLALPAGKVLSNANITAQERTDNDLGSDYWWRLSARIYTLSFETNGATTTPDDQQLEEGATPTKPVDPTKPGYRFLGWKNGDTIVDLDNFTMPDNHVTLTAAWEAKTYTIRFDTNGQQDATGTVNDQTYVYDTADAKLTAEVFASDTKKFLGWSLTTAATTASYRSGDAIDDAMKAAMIASQDGSVTLYAIWADKDAVTMTFNAGEGIFADNSKEKIESVRPGQQNPLPAAPTRDGYTFNGWASDSVDYPGLSKDATQTPVAIDGKNVTYTAKWVKNPTAQHTVTFRAGSNGSFTNANDRLISQSVESGKTVSGTPGITAESKYRFDGWQISGEAAVYTTTQVMAMAVTKNMTFIASYTYTGGNSGGGGGGGGSSATSYTIKASAGSGGSISPKGTVSVSRGGDKTFTMTASEGYKLADVLVDGKSVGAVDSYMFEKVRANHTIEVLFAKEGGVEDPKISGIADWLNTEEHVAFMTGYENGTFGTENAVTRAQVAQIFFNLLKDKDVRITVNFADVASNAWYAKAVNTLGSLGIVSGVGDNCFDPNRAITRAEFTAIAARFAKANETGSVRFSDVPVNAWYYNAVLTAVNYGWITGVGDNRFAPSEQITRAEAATIVNRMLARSADKAYVDATALRQFPDLSTSHWAYYQIMEASNAHGHRTNADGSESWTNLH